MLRVRTMSSVVIGIVCAASTLTAQAPAPPTFTAPKFPATTPGDCSKAATEWTTAQLTPILTALRSAPPEKRAELSSNYNTAHPLVRKESQRAATECSAAFRVETITPSQLVDLAQLYAFTGDTVNRRRATARVLSVTSLPPRQRANALLLAMQQELDDNSSYFGIIASAEKVVSAVDALPDSLNEIKVSAHQTMLGRYEYLDVAQGLRDHALALLKLARPMPTSGPKAVMRTNTLSGAFHSLARSYADMLHPDSALMILDKGEAEIGPVAKERFADFRNRYALIGTKAANIEGEWWLNSRDNAPMRMDDGKVHFVEFTAHWCGPCKNSYPGVVGLAERFKDAPFEGVMVTSLYGYLGTTRNLTPEQEVEADREYFGKEHAIPFRVAVNTMPKPTPGSGYRQPKPDTDYRVGGIPQIIVIDRQGIIRQIITGWDQGNTKRLGDLITKLVADERR
jgi:thiol-disulfide isomerase/thioredoxin